MQQDISSLTICPCYRSELGLVENAAENEQGKKQFAKFRILQIEEGKHECFTGKYTTRKIHKNYVRDPSGLFSVISHASLTMT